MPLSQVFDAEVSQLLASHPHKYRECLEEIRLLVLGADYSISEGIKWNSMSFRTHEWFATWNQRAEDKIQFVFHLGAKKRKVDSSSMSHDLGERVEWKSGDRCLVNFADSEDVMTCKQEFVQFVRTWIANA